jgi:hypothetical protein
MRLAVDRCDDENFLFACYEFTGLDPGYMFRFRLTGLNRLGAGPASQISYSVYTNAAEPCKPLPPFIAKATLTTIKFQWHAPDDQGAAIIGYRIQIKHLNNRIEDLPRSQTTYKLYNLRPGQSYFVKVLAKNGVGWSEYSDYNTLEESRTMIAIPDTPENPTPIAGTFCSITLKLRLPYGNGSEVSSFSIQKRIIETFSRGEWTSAGDSVVTSASVTLVEPAEADNVIAFISCVVIVYLTLYTF